MGIAQGTNAVGAAVLGPGSVSTIIGAVGLAALSGYPFGFWMFWGVVGIVVSGVLGAWMIRPVALAAARGEPVQERLFRLHLVNAVILLSVVLAMVFKPTFGM